MVDRVIWWECFKLTLRLRFADALVVALAAAARVRWDTDPYDG